MEDKPTKAKPKKSKTTRHVGSISSRSDWNGQGRCCVWNVPSGMASLGLPWGVRSLVVS